MLLNSPVSCSEKNTFVIRKTSRYFVYCARHLIVFRFTKLLPYITARALPSSFLNSPGVYSDKYKILLRKAARYFVNCARHLIVFRFTKLLPCITARASSRLLLNSPGVCSGKYNILIRKATRYFVYCARHSIVFRFTKLLLPNACSKRSIAKFFNSPSGDVITIHKKVKYKIKSATGSYNLALSRKFLYHRLIDLYFLSRIARLKSLRQMYYFFFLLRNRKYPATEAAIMLTPKTT